MEAILDLFQSVYQSNPLRTDILSGSGSNRKYYRFTLASHQTVIGVEGISQEENRAFITLSKHFQQKKLPVPQVFAVSSDELSYLQDDLGNTSLFDTLSTARKRGEQLHADGTYGEVEYELLTKTIRLLPHFQINGAEGLDFSICYPQSEMNDMNVMFDLNYFKYCFLKPSGVDFHEVKLELDFRAFANELCSNQNEQPPTFLYRDFQARNVMLMNGKDPYFIDFQGGRKGPIYYDLASFLWQASARYPQELRYRLLKEYEDELQKLQWHLPSDGLYANLQPWLLFRILQVLGAYGFRGYYEHKKHFLDSIPQALDNLRSLLNNNVCKYSYLRQVLEIMLKKYNS